MAIAGHPGSDRTAQKGWHQMLRKSKINSNIICNITILAKFYFHMNLYKYGPESEQAPLSPAFTSMHVYFYL